MTFAFTDIWSRHEQSNYEESKALCGPWIDLGVERPSPGDIAKWKGRAEGAEKSHEPGIFERAKAKTENEKLAAYCTVGT
jgi:hypothetical protein